MSFREYMFAVVLTVAAAAVVVGVGQVHLPSAWIVAGLFGAVIAWLMLATDEAEADGGDDE